MKLTPRAIYFSLSQLTALGSFSFWHDSNSKAYLTLSWPGPLYDRTRMVIYHHFKLFRLLPKFTLLLYCWEIPKGKQSLHFLSSLHCTCRQFIIFPGFQYVLSLVIVHPFLPSTPITTSGLLNRDGSHRGYKNLNPLFWSLLEQISNNIFPPTLDSPSRPRPFRFESSIK